MLAMGTTAVAWPVFAVPANSSRFMRSPGEAIRQPVASVELAWREDDPYLYNRAFEPRKISFDGSYCTSVVDLGGVTQVPTMDYFAREVLPHVDPRPRVLDIGCGQGEFVTMVRMLGVDAVGFDPALRIPSPFLHKRYWTPADQHADLFVMRCVLPHIQQPWEFIQRVGEANPGALMLIEFQRLEWITSEGIWYQLSHDHVNVFAAGDFRARFDVVADGTFANGEWAWVLVRADSYREPQSQTCVVADDVSALLKRRQKCIDQIALLDRPVAIWGAAGKGIVLAKALLDGGADVVAAIDADPSRHGKFMEVSGLQVLSIERASKLVPKDAIALVCNPNHMGPIHRSALALWDLMLPSDFAKGV